MSVTLKTSKGDVKIELHCAEAPRACENFLALCASGRYTGTKLHRLVKGFLVQGGDPTGTGQVSESIWGGHFKDEIVDGLKFDRRGVLGMASEEKDKNGSQFFITLAPVRHLDGVNTVFGHVIWGQHTLDAIEATPVVEEKPKEDITIEKVIIHCNPIAEKSLDSL